MRIWPISVFLFLLALSALAPDALCDEEPEEEAPAAASATAAPVRDDTPDLDPARLAGFFSPADFEVDCDAYTLEPGNFFEQGGLFHPYPGPFVVDLEIDRPEVKTGNGEPLVYNPRGRPIRSDELSDRYYLRFEFGPAPTPLWEDALFGDEEDYYFPFHREAAWLSDFLDFTSERYWNLHPGVDFGHADTMGFREFRFQTHPGTDPDVLKFQVTSADELTLEDARHLACHFECGKLVLHEPRVYQVMDGIPYEIPARYRLEDVGVSVDFVPLLTPPVPTNMPAPPLRDTPRALLTILVPPLVRVHAGGQWYGPNYDFLMSQYEIRNDAFALFLNDVQANSNAARAANIHFDGDGNAWFNEDMQSDRDELFDISDSRLVYIATNRLGMRYEVSGRVTREMGSYTNHPVVGVSWFGALKYCNWLTVVSGRGAVEVCYREGPDQTNWAPVTSAPTNWVRGVFTPAERQSWLSFRGFRLPMDDSWGNETRTNRFNEFYKAAAWTGRTNAFYGFGRNEVDLQDANYHDRNLFMKHDTASVGYYDGSDHGGAFLTRTNDNLYEIFDLSGNVEEWMSDLGNTNSIEFRALCGGSWLRPLPDLREREMAPPHTTTSYLGFRVVTTADENMDMFLVRIPYWICGCGHGLGPKEEEEGEKKEEEEKKDDRLDPKHGPGYRGSEGILYKFKPKEIIIGPASPG